MAPLTGRGVAADLPHLTYHTHSVLVCSVGYCDHSLFPNGQKKKKNFRKLFGLPSQLNGKVDCSEFGGRGKGDWSSCRRRKRVAWSCGCLFACLFANRPNVFCTSCDPKIPFFEKPFQIQCEKNLLGKYAF